MNRAIYITVFVLLLNVCFSFSQTDYSVDRIPKELLENAGSVVRINQIDFTVKSWSDAKLEVKYAITILHESHKEKAYFRQVFDKFSKINNIEITMFDQQGKKIKKVKSHDIYELSTFSASALFADIRQKVHTPDHFSYPFTVEHVYTISYDALLSYPSFFTYSDYNVSLEYGEFIVKVPLELRYSLQNTKQEPVQSQNEEMFAYKWVFENIKALKKEEYDLRLSDLIPGVKTAPTNFEMKGYFGNSETWDNFGLWIYSLNEGRDELPQSTKMEIVELTKNAESTREKVKLVYEYMQSKTRYVNVVIGIGGWQPFSATDVDEDGYGDCKALTNYTYSLLKAAGIQSFYTIIKAGDNVQDVERGFPCNQFNHAILCVPDENDTIWLECTSQRNPFDYLGTFTEGRDVLLITESRGKLVQTPPLNIDDNRRIRKATVIIDELGNAKAEIRVNYQGSYYDGMLGIYYLEGKRRMDWVRKNIHIRNFSLNDTHYSINQYLSELPFFVEEYFVFADRYVKKMGDRLLFDINFFNTKIDVPSVINKQESDIYIHRSQTRIDSLKFVIPDGYVVQSYPENDTLYTEYGTFSSQFSLKENTLIYSRKQLVNKGVYPSNQFDEFRSYLKKVSICDSQKVLVVPAEN